MGVRRRRPERDDRLKREKQTRMPETARRVDLGDIAFVIALVVGLAGVYLLAGVGGTLAVGGFGAAALLWRSS